MGCWGDGPLDSDAGADWIGDVMRMADVRSQWLKAVTLDAEEHVGVLYTAVWLFVQLGHVYAWPVKHYNQDLGLAMGAAEALHEQFKLLGLGRQEATARLYALQLRARFDGLCRCDEEADDFYFAIAKPEQVPGWTPFDTYNKTPAEIVKLVNSKLKPRPGSPWFDAVGRFCSIDRTVLDLVGAVLRSDIGQADEIYVWSKSRCTLVRLLDIHDRDWLVQAPLGDLFMRGELDC